MKAGQSLTSPRKWKRRCEEVTWGLWNVRSFYSQLRVDGEGLLQVEGTDPEAPATFCSVLAKAGISLCCISEHRWRGEDSFGDHLILFSGLPWSATKAEQGVGIVPNPATQRAWHAADSFFEFGGSRLLRITVSWFL